MAINTDAIDSIMQAFALGHSIAQQKEEFKQQKKVHEDVKAQQQAELKQRQTEFAAEQDRLTKQFEAQQKLQAAIHDLAKTKDEAAFTQEYSKTGNTPPNTKITKPVAGVTGDYNKGFSSESLNDIPIGSSKLTFPSGDTVNAQDPATYAQSEANRLRTVGEPKQEFDLEKINLQNKARAAITAATNNAKIQFEQQKSADDFKKAIELQKLKNAPAYARIEVEKQKVANGEVKLASADAKRLQFLDKVERQVSELESALNAGGWDYYQGPSGILNNVLAFKGEDDPTWAKIRSLAGDLRGTITTDEAGKTLSKTEQELLNKHAPDADHMIPAEQIRQQINLLKSSLPEMRNSVYANLAGSKIQTKDKTITPKKPLSAYEKPGGN